MSEIVRLGKGKEREKTREKKFNKWCYHYNKFGTQHQPHQIRHNPHSQVIALWS